MSDNNSVSDANNDTTGRIMRWLSVVSAFVTVGLTITNAIWTNKNTDIKNELEKKQFELSSELGKTKSNLERYTFVQQTLNGVSKLDDTQKALAINLTYLALNQNEANRLYSGLEVSKDTSANKIGLLGNNLKNAFYYTIYLHLGKHDKAEETEPLKAVQDALSSSGFIITGNDNQRDEYGPGVDYFYAKDKLGAEKVVETLNQLKKSDEKPFTARFQSGGKQPEGTLGIWF